MFLHPPQAESLFRGLCALKHQSPLSIIFDLLILVLVDKETLLAREKQCFLDI